MPTTYEAIATVTVGAGGASSIEFTGIAADWTDLLIKYSLRDNLSAVYNNSLITFNNSTTGYSEREIGGNGSVAFSSSQSAANLQYNRVNSATSTSNTFANGELYIPNYAGSTNKSMSGDNVIETNASGNVMGLTASLWSNTAAITSIKIAASGASFVQYSTATLYGIKNS